MSICHWGRTDTAISLSSSALCILLTSVGHDQENSPFLKQCWKMKRHDFHFLYGHIDQWFCGHMTFFVNEILYVLASKD